MQHPFEVIHGDCLEALRSLGAETADAVITDPPYCAGGKSESERMRGRSMLGSDSPWGWFTGDNLSTTGLAWLLRSVAFQAERILRPGGSLLVFCDWRMWTAIVPAMESAGLGLQSMIVWDKGSAGLGVGFRATHELIAHLRKGKGPFHSRAGSNVVRHRRVVGKGKEHPTQKPVELMVDLLRVVTPPGGLIVDPFCGSGSTGVAALQEGRRFIGIERDAGFVQVARARLEDAAAHAKEAPPCSPSS